MGFDWDDPFNCEEYGEYFGLTYPIVDDSDYSLFTQFATGYIPHHVIIDHEMVVRYSVHGYFVENMIQTIQDLLIELPRLDVKPIYNPNDLTLPKEFVLHQNFPNPFNTTTTIRYELPEESQVTLVIYDILGHRVETLVNGVQNSGYKSIAWGGTDVYGRPVGTGVYLYQIKAGDFTQRRKMILLK